MLMAQITDIHLGFDPDNPGEFNRKRLDQTIRALCDREVRPDMLLATGDLVDRGDEASYRRLKGALSTVPFPVHMCLGNHDVRDNFYAQFPDQPRVDGFLQYEVDAGDFRLLFLDTLEEGRHGGGFCETRARWLTDRLADDTDRPVILVQHHPPVETGIDWMTTDADEPWVRRLSEAIGSSRQVKGMITGHLHRNISTWWRDISMAICASTAPQVALDFRPIDPDQPDGRPMIVADPPCYAMHWWNGRQLVTHFDMAEEHLMLARYDEKMQPLVQHLLGERPA